MDNRGVAAGAGMGGFMLGLLSGAIVAGLTVLFLAPRSGQETRAIIMGKATETRDLLKGQLSDVKEKLKPR